MNGKARGEYSRSQDRLQGRLSSLPDLSVLPEGEPIGPRMISGPRWGPLCSVYRERLGPVTTLEIRTTDTVRDMPGELCDVRREHPHLKLVENV